MALHSSKTQKNAVVVIAYKALPTLSELCSFKQCLKILSQHPIHIVFPENLDTSAYKDLAAKHNIPLLLSPFPDHNFESVRTYSKLLLTAEFYERFAEYDHILIYQLDAWVFKDELAYWCQAGYHYIGAPFFQGHGLSTRHSPLLPFAGNGGFSLRCVASFIKLLTKKVPYQHNPHTNDSSPSAESIFLNVSVMSLFMDTDINEDLFFAEYGPKLDPNFIVAPPMESIPFSFEIQPRLLFGVNKFQLPFGCHAYEKYDWDFWKDKITLCE